MSVQTLLQKGADNCSKLEKAADAILVLPRLLWLGRDVSVRSEGGKPKITDRMGTSFVNTFGRNMHKRAEVEGSELLFIAGAIGLVLGSIIAAPLLAVGLACKKIALLTSPRSKAYHAVVRSAHEGAKLLQEMRKLQYLQQNLHQSIRNLDDFEQNSTTHYPNRARHAKKCFGGRDG